MDDIVDELDWLLKGHKAEGDPNGDFRESKTVIAAIAEIKQLREQIIRLSKGITK